MSDAAAKDAFFKTWFEQIKRIDLKSEMRAAWAAHRARLADGEPFYIPSSEWLKMPPVPLKFEFVLDTGSQVS